MLHKTRGIVFHSSKYRETSLVVQIYTEVFGIQSYIINSVRKKHAKIHQGIFQPLTLVDLVVYHKERPGLQRISDIRPQPPLVSIPFDVFKSSIVLFLNEVLYKSIREEESNPSLFDFIFNSILWLDEPHAAGNDFHLLFMVQLSRYLGFHPQNNYSQEENIFNLREGCFQSDFPKDPHFIPQRLAGFFSEMIGADFSFASQMQTADRRTLIEYLLEYFALHLDGFGNIKSHKVLEEIWG